MTWLALSLAALATPAPPQPPPPWRLYTSPSLHLGVRPAVLVTRDELGAGVTLQLSTLAL